MVLATCFRDIVIYILPTANDYGGPYDVSKYYDSTYEYLKSCGIKDISEAIDLFIKSQCGQIAFFSLFHFLLQYNHLYNISSFSFED